MIWLYKAKNWIVAHKNWLVLVGLFVLSYVLGRRSNQNYLEMANLAKDQYKKENEELERLQKARQVRDKRAEQKAKAVKAALEVEKEKRLKELEKQKANILRVLYADNYEIICKFNPEMLDILKEEVDEYFEKQFVYISRTTKHQNSRRL